MCIRDRIDDLDQRSFLPAPQIPEAPFLQDALHPSLNTFSEPHHSIFLANSGSILPTFDQYGPNVPGEFPSYMDYVNNDNEAFDMYSSPINVANIQQFADILSDYRSSVIYVRGFDGELVSANMIYNLFSNFGNIVKIMYTRAKGIAFIEFENMEYAAIARDYLNNVTLLSSTIRISFSRHEGLIPRVGASDEEEEEWFVGSPATNRFKAAKTLSINPPSDTLHMSNLLIFYCKEDILRPLFGAYGNIEGMRFLFHENNRNMCQIRFTTLQEAVWALTNLHNYDLGGRKIQISFTRSKM
eukprot:TRINITY_DN10664_c0_g1_i4.p1 TRINITY_DN10664_c0_g1~~TRINITY_DN10664_c0_g1_i4.p1  ORF type:complete len:299 (-),score=50.52 TRINITY_DN10664_c0_g1_i4:88-984(-)